MALPFVVLAFAHSPWWLVALLLGALARVAKSLWVRREGRGLIWLLKPIQFAGVGVVAWDPIHATGKVDEVCTIG